ncbi:MAG: hypothetical protein ABIT01_14240 [Thermoanaerobaculia bacterium]
MFQSIVVFSLLMAIKAVSLLFFRHRLDWVGSPPADRWERLRLIALLHHTSLFEPIFLAVVPNHVLWRLARHGVIPAASKTTDRPLVGLLYRFVARRVIPITRERDHTWTGVLDEIGADSMVVMAPEGRMMRADGRDSGGNPMTVRGGIADVLSAIGTGRMLLAYSGGLHHVQVPGKWPRPWKTVRVRAEVLEIEAYRHEVLAAGTPEEFKRAVKSDLERRRDLHRPIAE